MIFFVWLLYLLFIFYCSSPSVCDYPVLIQARLRLKKHDTIDTITMQMIELETKTPFPLKSKMLWIFAYRCTDLVIHNFKMININEGAAWCADCQATSGHLCNLLCVLHGEVFTPYWTNDQVSLCKITPCIYTSVFLTLWECFIDDSLLAVQQWGEFDPPRRCKV